MRLPLIDTLLTTLWSHSHGRKYMLLLRQPMAIAAKSLPKEKVRDYRYQSILRLLVIIIFDIDYFIILSHYFDIRMLPAMPPCLFVTDELLLIFISLKYLLVLLIFWAYINATSMPSTARWMLSFSCIYAYRHCNYIVWLLQRGCKLATCRRVDVLSLAVSWSFTSNIKNARHMILYATSQ